MKKSYILLGVTDLGRCICQISLYYILKNLPVSWHSNYISIKIILQKTYRIKYVWGQELGSISKVVSTALISKLLAPGTWSWQLLPRVQILLRFCSIQHAGLEAIGYIRAGLPPLKEDKRTAGWQLSASLGWRINTKSQLRFEPSPKHMAQWKDLWYPKPLRTWAPNHQSQARFYIVTLIC